MEYKDLSKQAQKRAKSLLSLRLARFITSPGQLDNIVHDFLYSASGKIEKIK